MALVVKSLPAKAGDVRDRGSIPGSGRSSGEGNGKPLQYSCLENPMDRLKSWTVQRAGPDGSNLVYIMMSTLPPHDLRCILSLFPVYSILPLFFFLILKLNTQQHWAFCYSMNTICLIWDTFCWFCDISTFQFSSVTELCPTLCDPMDCSTSGLPVYHQLEFSQTHVHSVGDPFNNLCFTYSFLENSLMFQVLI